MGLVHPPIAGECLWTRGKVMLDRVREDVEEGCRICGDRADYVVIRGYDEPGEFAHYPLCATHAKRTDGVRNWSKLCVGGDS